MATALEFPEKINFYTRPDDADRNGQFPLNKLTGFGITFRIFAIYRMIGKQIDRKFTNFVKAQHVTYRDGENNIQFRNIKDPSQQQARAATFNYLLEYGTSSYWQIAHLKDLFTNRFIGDNIVLNVGVNRYTRRPLQKLNDKIKELCNQNKQIYSLKYDINYYYKLKQLLSSHISKLNQIKIIKNEDSNNNIYSVKMQLRWSDEDGNKHFNSTQCIKLIEDCFFEWNKDLRDHKNGLFIKAISAVYWKEISVEKCPVIVATIFKNDDGYFYGTLHSNNESKVGFAVKLSQKNGIKSKL